MPGENLTRAEAIERAAIVRTRSYEVALDLTRGPEVFGSTTTVRFDATPGASTFIDAITASVRSITLNGRAIDPSAADGARIALDGLAEHNELVVDADFAYTNTGEGLHRFVDPADGQVYLYTQFEVPDSRRVFAVFEQPDLKATFAFTVTGPAGWTVVSNSPAPEPEPVSEGVARWSFPPTPVISSYITALIAGPYVQARGELTSSDGRTIALGAYCRASLAEYLDADYVFEKTRQGFAFYESLFDYPYPFEKYDQLFVPEFNAGAMENAGAVTFTETYVFRSKVTDAIRERRVVTILHELAHMWFGDLVTMRWWNDLWLNESFAEYASTLATAEATEWTRAWTTFAALEKGWAYRQDQLPSTHPIVAEIRDLEDVQVNFDGITYAKGASVLKQLVAWVGRDHFFAGIARYFRAHAHGNTELRDLLTELEATSGRDLAAWSSAWLETAGVNTLRSELAEGPDGTIASYAIVQEAPADHPRLRPHRLAVGSYELVDGRLTRTERIELDVDGERTEVPELAGRPRPALILLNDDDLAYAKIRLDGVSHATALAHLADIADPLARSLVWGAVWDATRDAETPARDYVRLVLDNVAAETESTTLRTVLANLIQAGHLYVAPDAREGVLVQIADRLLALAREAAPGSDAQFQFLKSFATVARTPAHAAALQGLLDGSEELAGLEIDTDLAWELLIGLVACAGAGEPEIATALERDTTATGQQAAANARAAIPTAEAKRAAWDSLFARADASNLIVRSTALGFQRANDVHLLEPFRDRYFDSLLEVWNSRSYAIASALIVGMYPAALADEALRDAGRAWLASNPGVPALRRLVVENLAGTERALAAQARDARADG